MSSLYIKYKWYKPSNVHCRSKQVLYLKWCNHTQESCHLSLLLKQNADTISGRWFEDPSFAPFLLRALITSTSSFLLLYYPDPRLHFSLTAHKFSFKRKEGSTLPPSIMQTGGQDFPLEFGKSKFNLHRLSEPKTSWNFPASNEFKYLSD